MDTLDDSAAPFSNASLGAATDPTNATNAMDRALGFRFFDDATQARSAAGIAAIAADANTWRMRRAFPAWAARMSLTGEDDGGFDHDGFTEPCPFLVEDKCAVYPVRPYCCRNYLAWSPECRYPTTPGRIPGRRGTGAGTITTFHQNRLLLLNLLWAKFGVDGARARGHFLPDLVLASLDGDDEALFAQCLR